MGEGVAMRHTLIRRVEDAEEVGPPRGGPPGWRGVGPLSPSNALRLQTARGKSALVALARRARARSESLVGDRNVGRRQTSQRVVTRGGEWAHTGDVRMLTCGSIPACWLHNEEAALTIRTCGYEHPFVSSLDQHQFI